MEQLAVNVTIIGKTYKLKVAQDSEQALRGVVKQINDTAEVLKKQFAGLEDFDYLAMSLIQYLGTLKPDVAEDYNYQIAEKVEKLLVGLKS
jgi:cell division protein ZapA (FtsZ GTPase activity inhibitor)